MTRTRRQPPSKLVLGLLLLALLVGASLLLGPPQPLESKTAPNEPDAREETSRVIATVVNQTDSSSDQGGSSGGQTADQQASPGTASHGALEPPAPPSAMARIEPPSAAPAPGPASGAAPSPDSSVPAHSAGPRLFDEVDASRYDLVLVENTKGNPMAITQPIWKRCKELVREIPRGKLESRAHALFDWLAQHVPYDKEQLARINAHVQHEYRDAQETFDDKTGVCGELAVLYIVMARAVGLQAKFVHVTVDVNGRPVAHACAAISLDVGRAILVDPAYHAFGIRHRRFEVWDDDKVIQVFRGWNREWDSRFR